ncbi:MAG: reverse transcriptase-like protein [Nesterenkonia sp.]
MTLIVEADGGSRGNPGIAGSGALLRRNGTIIDAVAVPLGPDLTNNVAEYEGLIAGLVLARNFDPSAEIQVRMDSKLVVEQMSGTWRIKHPDMQALADQARTIIGASQIAYTWIPRRKNTDADALSNEAMDCVSSGSDWSMDSSPFCLEHGLTKKPPKAMSTEDAPEWDLDGLETAELEDLALAVADELRRRR